MSAAKHTPGPWITDDVERDDLFRYVAPVAGFRYAPNICRIHVNGGIEQHPRDVAEANARLIAAAPELLEALVLMENAQARIDALPMFPTTHATEAARFKLFDARKAASAAIAKATGEAA